MACVKKRGSGYRVDWRDKKGNRYRKTFELKKDADNFVADIEVKMKERTYVAPKEVPTLRSVAEQWFANKRGQKLRPSTLVGYRVNLDRHIGVSPTVSSDRCTTLSERAIGVRDEEGAAWRRNEGWALD